MSSKTTFSKFSNTAKPKDADIPPEADAMPPPTTPRPSQATPSDARAVTIFGAANIANALMAVTDQSESHGAKSPFPLIQVTGGATGGLFAAVKGTADQEILDQLPQGNKPVKGIFLAYRTELLSWPEGYVEGQEKHANPSWKAVISAGAVAEAQLAYKACEAYQFTKKDDKAKFDFASSDVGHVRPQLQMLVFLPDIGDVAVVQVPAYFSSWVETQKTLRLLIDPETQALGQFPCCIRVVTNEVQNKAKTQNWKVHHCDITQAVDAVTKKAWEQYQPWVAALQDAPEKLALFQDWLEGGDAPMTDEIRARLRKAASL